jgi:hypothetical protein
MTVYLQTLQIAASAWMLAASWRMIEGHVYGGQLIVYELVDDEAAELLAPD